MNIFIASNFLLGPFFPSKVYIYIYIYILILKVDTYFIFLLNVIDPNKNDTCIIASVCFIHIIGFGVSIYACCIINVYNIEKND